MDELVPGGLSTLETSVTGFPSMANSFSFVVCVAVAISLLVCREGLQVLILRHITIQYSSHTLQIHDLLNRELAVFMASL